MHKYAKEIKNNKLRKFIDSSKIDRKEIAKMLGLKSEQAIIRWENGETMPDGKSALTLGHILNTGIEKIYPDLWNRSAGLSADTDVVNAQNVASSRDIVNTILNTMNINREGYIVAVTIYYDSVSAWDSAAQMYAARSQYEMAYGYYERASEWQNAQNMADSIVDTNLQKLLVIRLAHAQSGLSFDSLSAGDSATIVTIGSSFPYTHAGEIARIWFIQAHKLLYYEVMPANDTTNGGGGQRDAPYSQPHSQPGSKISGSKPYINIYPNPARDNATVSIINSQWDAGSVITVTDVYGRKICTVKPAPNSTQTDIDTQSWIDGVYFFSVHLSDGSVFNRKLVIQK